MPRKTAGALLLLLLLTPTTPAHAQPPDRDCAKTYDRSDWHGVSRKVHRDSHRTRVERRRLRRVFACQARPRKSRPILRMHARRYKAAWHRRFRWVIGWRNLSSYDRAWAINTSLCESGRSPATNTGNGYYGAHQWALSTAWAAGFTKRPDFTSLAEQDVRAVRWRNQAGAGQWPVCGH